MQHLIVSPTCRVPGPQLRTNPHGIPPSLRLRRLRHVRPSASEEDDRLPAKRKFITREEEPDEYWRSKGEREGANPLADPIAIIGLIAIFAPFVILGVAVGVGYVDLTP